MKNSIKRNSYNIIDRSKLVVFIDPTLGYESIARKNKTVCFSIRGKSIKDKSFNFGWPNQLNLTGPFWTSIYQKNKMNSILNYNYYLENKIWINKNIKVLKKIMNFDKNNSKIKKYLEKI